MHSRGLDVNSFPSVNSKFPTRRILYYSRVLFLNITQLTYSSKGTLTSLDNQYFQNNFKSQIKHVMAILQFYGAYLKNIYRTLVI